MHRRGDLIADGLPAAVEGVGLPNRTVPATVGVVIDLVLPVCCIIPDLVRLNADNIPLLRPAQDGLVHHIADGIGKERHNVDPHGSHPLDEVDSDEQTVVSAAMAVEKIAKIAEGKKLLKVIHIKNKLVNLILK